MNILLKTILAICIVKFQTVHASQKDTKSNDTKLEMESDTWPVFTTNRSDSKVCFTSSIPQSSEGTFQKRSSPSLTFSTKDGKNFVLIATSGYSYSIEQKNYPTIEILQTDKTKKQFDLVPIGQNAIIQKQDITNKIIFLSKKSSTIKISGTSHIGTTSQDLYTLSGFTKSIEKASALCGAKTSNAKSQEKPKLKKVKK